MREEENESPESLEDLLSALTPKERLFCLEYIKHFNGAKAARDAGYSEDSARVIASQNLTKLNISRAVSLLAAERIMSDDEGMIKLTEWGRGSFEPFLSVDGTLDLTTRQARENIGLIKKVKQTKRVIIEKDSNGEGEELAAELVSIEIELHDPKDAVKSILEARGKLIKRFELTGKDGDPLQTITIFQLPDNGRDPA